ncbi:MAG: hypothetical protein KDD19_24625 [Phaeodactylibacter sp.]|nr:hypothetical protein [Phaeodactylibacter sp.]MCB9050834.1 hypothetical protein [Lewinellaceae bacterium]
MPPKAHRGRFQAQGDGLEESESWSQDEPLTKSNALELLGKLKGKLKPADVEKRKKSFEKAKRMIEDAEGGIDAVKKRSFYDDRKRRDIRVDVEILGGKAFVTIIIIIILLAAWKIL